MLQKLKQSYRRRRLKRASRKRIRELLASADPILLELGAGKKKGENGWVTSDITVGPDLFVDLLEPFPFPDSTVEMVYSSHVLEHFSTRQLETILQECRRVLRPGGIISVCVPDAEIYIRAYGNPEEFDPAKYCRYKPAYRFYSKIDYINYMAYMDGFHCHLFDRENLIALLNASGFHEVRIRDFDPETDMVERDHISIYAQGIKR